MEVVQRFWRQRFELNKHVCDNQVEFLFNPISDKYHFASHTMGRFKTPAPAPPTTPYSRTPMRQPTTTPRATSVRSTRVPSTTVNQASSLSLLAAFDELCRNGSVLQEHSDKQLISHIQASGEWRKKYKSAEAEEKRLNSIIFQKDRELTAFEQRIRQARKFVEEEVKVMPCTVSVK